MSPQESAREGIRHLQRAVSGVLTAHRPMSIPEIAQVLGIEEIHDHGSSPRSVYNRVEHLIRYVLSKLEVEGSARKHTKGWLLIAASHGSGARRSADALENPKPRRSERLA